jgi:ribosomal protein L37AE/L43A
MDYQFTAQVEDWLDDVSRGERDWVKALRDFYDPFALALAAAPPKMAAFKGQYRSTPSQPESNAEGEASAEDQVSQRKRTRRNSRGSRRSSSRTATGKKASAADPNAPLCPKCGSPMVKRAGPRGEFWGCSTFPKCKGTRNV